MLHVVLNIPPELWNDDIIDKLQRYSRYIQASKRIIELEEKLEKINSKINSQLIPKKI